MKILLNADDFKCLVSGGILLVNDKNNKLVAEIMLQDIGFHTMIGMIENTNKEDFGKVFQKSLSA